MNKFDRLREISNDAAQQASADCASKIEKLTSNQLDTIIEELKKSGANRSDVTRLCQEIQTSTDKNKTVQNFVHKSEIICQAVADIVGRIL